VLIIKKPAAIIDDYERAIPPIARTKIASKELLVNAFIFSLKFNGSQIKYLVVGPSISESSFYI